jgi:hypothetical protein
VVAVLAFAGGALFSLGAAGFMGYTGLLIPGPRPAIFPRAWALDPSQWSGFAGFAYRFQSGNLAWAGVTLGALLVATAAVAVLHPGVFERPRPYPMSAPRQIVAYLAALLIGVGAPLAISILALALAPDMVATTFVNLGLARTMALVFIGFAAPLWMIAGPGLFNVRAAIRFGHGAVAGLAMWAACALGALLAEPMRTVAELATVGNVLAAVDVGRGSPGATFGWVVCWTATVYGLTLAVAGTIAVVSAPQSLGPKPRTGAAVPLAAALLLLLGAGWAVDRGADARLAAAAPDLASELGLETTAPPRPVVLLTGEDAKGRRVPPLQALHPRLLSADCAGAPLGEDRVLPAASEANLTRLEAWLNDHREEVSGLAARATGCRVAILARLFRPEEARALVMGDPRPARVGFFAFRFALGGLNDIPPDPALAAIAGGLSDTSRYARGPGGDSLLARLSSRAASPGTAEVRGRLVVPNPEAWRVGLVVGAPPGTDPWLFAPRTDGLALRFMSSAVSPGPDGGFAFRGVGTGTWQLSLLAPEGTDPSRLAALSVSGDPGQFVVAAASRRDLGSIVLRY